MGKRILVKVGDKLHRLTALEYLFSDDHHRRHFKWSCDCGNTIILQAGAVTSGNTKSCGCLAREIKKAKKLPNNRAEINQIVLGYKRHARDRNLTWKLSFGVVEGLIRGNCFYCGGPPSNTKYTKNCLEGFKYNGIDRIDSSKGYLKNNVVSACKICNLAKRDITLAEFRTWLARIFKHQAMAEQWSNLE